MAGKQRKHLDRVAALGCILCAHLGQEQTSKTDVHHIRTGAGMAERQSDWLTVPLCHHGCHQGPCGVHGDRTLLRIAKMDELDLLALTYEALM